MMKRVLSLFFILFISATQAFAATAACGTAVSTVEDSDNDGSTVAPAFTTCAGTEICVTACVAYETSDGSPPTPTFTASGLSFTAIGSTTFASAGGFDSAVACARACGASGSTAYTVTASYGENIAWVPGLTVHATSGVDQTDPIDSSNATTDTSDPVMPISNNLTIVNANAFRYDFAVQGGNDTGDMTAGSSQTEITGSAIEYFMGYKQLTATGSDTGTVNGSDPTANDRAAMFSFAYKPSGGAARTSDFFQVFDI